MSYNPDPIFRDGLENYRKSAPASAWERVEAGLDRKRRKGVWLKVAAGLVLLISASTLLWQYDQSDSTIAAVPKESTLITLRSDSTIAVATEASASYQLSAVSYQTATANNPQFSKSNSIVERSRNNHPNVMSEGLPVVERSRNEHGKSSQQSSVGSRQSAYGRESSVACTERSRSISREVVDSPHETQQISVVKTDDLLETPASDIQIENSTEESVKDVAAEQKRTSINYTSEEVNKKFLKKELTAEATPAKKNTSGLQKVIDKALDLTNEGTVYGELREKKNEWLSFNMLSNKTEANK